MRTKNREDASSSKGTKIIIIIGKAKNKHQEETSSKGKGQIELQDVDHGEEDQEEEEQESLVALDKELTLDDAPHVPTFVNVSMFPLDTSVDSFSTVMLLL